MYVINYTLPRHSPSSAIIEVPGLAVSPSHLRPRRPGQNHHGGYHGWAETNRLKPCSWCMLMSYLCAKVMNNHWDATGIWMDTIDSTVMLQSPEWTKMMHLDFGSLRDPSNSKWLTMLHGTLRTQPSNNCVNPSLPRALRTGCPMCRNRS